jgi:nickel/cobalt exporter
MTNELTVLLIAAASIAFFHTLLGPDHYLPFIVMAKSGEWSLKKTSLITILCGLGHVLSSVVLGIVGVVLGIALFKLEALESFRGNLAAWGLIAFGFIYFIWGIRRAVRNKPHHHLHSHMNGLEHEHIHTHSTEHVHVHS